MKVPVIRAFFTLGLAAVIILTGITHDLIPHQHGHSDGETAIWQQLHSAVRHDEKKAVPIPDSNMADVIFTTLVSIICFASLSAYELEARGREPMRGRTLSRGIELYRKFA